MSLVTHRDDGAILSDRCGDGLSAVHAQAVRRYIELHNPSIINREKRDGGKKGEKNKKKKVRRSRKNAYCC